MQEFPVHPAWVHERHLELDQIRDILLVERAKRPDRAQRTLRSLEMECVTETLQLTGVPVTDTIIERSY